MTREEYLLRIQTDLQATISDGRYNNHKNQVIARKLSAQFKPTYDESLLWSRALYISSNACVLFLEKKDEKLAINCFKEAAEVYENLSMIAEKIDRDYAMLLSALCYDLSGFQANARCVVKQINEYSFITQDDADPVDAANYIQAQIRRILLKNIASANSKITSEFNFDFGVKYFNEALSRWFAAILRGEQESYIDELQRSYKYYLNSGNIFLSHLLFLLKTRIVVYNERSIWLNLHKDQSIRTSGKWKKYIKLLTNDIYDRERIKPEDIRLSKFEFWTSQIRAIEAGLLSTNNNYVVQMPTSAGKTFIAELAIVNSLIKAPGKKCIYISPFRALTNEKENELAEYISKLGFSVSALSGSYEVDEFQNIILDETDILVATPEKIDLLLRLTPAYFDNVELLIIDEGHIVGDISARSSLMEFLVIRLRMKVSSARILFISAVMPPENADEYSMWLSTSQNNVIRSLLHRDSPVGEDWEPTRKLIGAFTWDGDNGRISFKAVETEDEDTKVKTGAFIPALIKTKQYGGIFPNKTNKAQTSATIAYELSKQGNVLVFCAQARDTTRVGSEFLALLQIVSSDDNLITEEHFTPSRDKESYYYTRKWFGENHVITRCVEKGIGIHFGDLPEPVRRGVEADYNTGKLRVLISTNTVGQGLNFPIKYLIIHSTIITQNQTVTVRDFWNIVGRAGRAGKETEGQIIFNIKTPTDRKAFAKYTDKAKIEHAFSMFFNILNWLSSRRISAEVFANNLSLLSEPYLLGLLFEESVEESDQDVIERIINASLFKVQAENRQIDLTPLRNSFLQLFASVRASVPESMRTSFSETGLGVKSNLAISEFIDARLDRIRTIEAEDDYENLLIEIFQLFDNGGVSEMLSDKLNKIQLRPTQVIDIAKLWIQGTEIENLQATWLTNGIEVSHFHLLIADGFYYRYPWGIASFVTIMCAKLGKTRDALGPGIKNLSTFIKFGLNNPTACLAKGLGIKNRDSALILATKANGLEGKPFISWLANLTLEDVRDFGVSRYDELNILNVAIKLTPKREASTSQSYSFFVRGIPFEDYRKETSLEVTAGETLRFERDVGNQFDPFAIKIFRGEKELGFVPREFSKQIAVELDINLTDYTILVSSVESEPEYNRILVTMTQT